MHHIRHLYGFFDNHTDQFLRTCNNHNPVNRQRLKDGEGNVPCSRRHIHKHTIHVFPNNIGPKLFDCSGNHRSAPKNGVGFVFQQKIDGHNLNPPVGNYGIYAVFVSHRLAV